MQIAEVALIGMLYSLLGPLFNACIITPRRACAARGQVIAPGLEYIYRVCNFFLKLKKYSLSEVHFNTGRLLFKFHGLQCHFAAGQVFVAFANPASVPFG